VAPVALLGHASFFSGLGELDPFPLGSAIAELGSLRLCSHAFGDLDLDLPGLRSIDFRRLTGPGPMAGRGASFSVGSEAERLVHARVQVQMGFLGRFGGLVLLSGLLVLGGGQGLVRLGGSDRLCGLDALGFDVEERVGG
jgi:hypothetical protein